MSLPVGVQESLQRLDQGIAESEADLQSLFDLLHEHSAGEEIPGVTVFIQRKKGLLGHLRGDLLDLSERIEGAI
jgi:hypothetical protein